MKKLNEKKKNTEVTITQLQEKSELLEEKNNDLLQEILSLTDKCKELVQRNVTEQNELTEKVKKIKNLNGQLSSLLELKDQAEDKRKALYLFDNKLASIKSEIEKEGNYLENIRTEIRKEKYQIEIANGISLLLLEGKIPDAVSLSRHFINLASMRDSNKYRIKKREERFAKEVREVIVKAIIKLYPDEFIPKWNYQNDLMNKDIIIRDLQDDIHFKNNKIGRLEEECKKKMTK